MHIDQTGQTLSVETQSEAETRALGAALAELVEPGTVIGLAGPLGAGKTLLVRAVAEALGVPPDAISSPTFVLIHEYEGRMPVYHFDAYRLADPLQFDALGPSDYFQGEGVCLVEWSDRVPGRLPADAWTVRIEPLGRSARRFHITFGPQPQNGALHARLIARLSFGV